MTDDDKTQQPTNSDNLILAAIQSLGARIGGVEEVILARLNDTRPLDQQLLAKINEIVDKQTAMQQDFSAMRQEQTTMREDLVAMREEQATMREEMAAMREEMAATREEMASFRAETSSNFRVVNKKLGLLSNDFLQIRAEQDLLDQRVSKLEEEKAA